MNRPTLRAPAEQGGVLAVPPLDRVSQLLDQNRTAFDQYQLVIAGRPLSDLRRLARQSAVKTAQDYFAERGEPFFPYPSDAPLFLAGHQPELFHPGVWAKNFALQGLSRRFGATPLNLVVDNDVAKNAVLRIPSGSHIKPIPFDFWPGKSPYEEWRVHDESLFASLPKRLQEEMATWPFKPLLPAFWQTVLELRRSSSLAGERFTAARRTWEQRWGCANLEAPLSRLSTTAPFAWFVLSLMAEAPRLFTVYNEGVRAYRREHGIRSRSHPVPDLAADGDWLEMPFWGWRSGQRQRQRLFVRSRLGDWDLRAGADNWLTLSGAMEQRIAALQGLESQGCKLRPRALTTTWFARLFLADLFIHGLGGGLYDQLTDALMRRWYNIEPPRFMILTATLKLPFYTDNRAGERRRDLMRLRRDLWYNPQRHLPDSTIEDPPWSALVAERIGWTRRNLRAAAERKEQFEQIRRINDALHPRVQDQLTRLDRDLAEAQAEQRLHEVRQRRDYAFCLYPEEMLRPLMQGFL